MEKPLCRCGKLAATVCIACGRPICIDPACASIFGDHTVCVPCESEAIRLSRSQMPAEMREVEPFCSFAT